MRKKLLRSRSGFEKPESREEAIMQNILGASNVLEPSESNIEEILKSILYNTPYTKEAEFEIEKILLAIKNNGTYDGEGESRDMKILIAILNDLDYTEEAESRIEELFIEWLNQRSKVKVLEGIPPLTFVAKGEPLINYEISGNTTQSGTPTPNTPIMPQGTGDLETVGAKVGQYKIPISSANTTTPVYLGEVETTRKVKKLVFDGTENWYTAVSSTGLFGIQRFEPMQAQPFISGYSAVSNCYVYNPVQSGIDAATVSGEFVLQAFRAGSTWQYNFFIKDERYDDLTAWKSYLAAQYAAGTPVCVLYVLVEPTTGIVNEPLMKIGDYADTLSKEQAGVEIPTNNGSTTLDVGTTVKPSNVYIEYK